MSGSDVFAVICSLAAIVISILANQISNQNADGPRG